MIYWCCCSFIFDLLFFILTVLYSFDALAMLFFIHVFDPLFIEVAFVTMLFLYLFSLVTFPLIFLFLYLFILDVALFATSFFTSFITLFVVWLVPLLLLSFFVHFIVIFFVPRFLHFFFIYFIDLFGLIAAAKSALIC